MSKIVIIATYFGKLPNYINLWLKSCSYNKNIDFLLVTDDIIDKNIYIPKNVYIKNMNMSQLIQLIEKNTGIKPNIKKAYKLCDFRPAYGYIFKEYINEYDFWGHCDLDMIFGDIRKFITDDVLNKYNKILNRGHLTLYKNNEKVNKYYRLQSDNINYSEIFSSENNYIFDEWDGIHKLLNEHNISQYHDEFIADIDPRYKKFKCTGIKNYKHQVFEWDEGKIYQTYKDGNKIKRNELAYIHFQKRKFNETIYLHKDRFYITPDGFKECKEEISIKDLKKYNRDNILYFFNNRLVYYIKKIKNKVEI